MDLKEHTRVDTFKYETSEGDVYILYKNGCFERADIPPNRDKWSISRWRVMSLIYNKIMQLEEEMRDRRGDIKTS